MFAIITKLTTWGGIDKTFAINLSLGLLTSETLDDLRFQIINQTPYPSYKRVRETFTDTEGRVSFISSY